MKQVTLLFAVIVLCSVQPAPAVGQDINLSGTWILDRNESDINSASGLMEREDFAGPASQKDVGIPGREGSGGPIMAGDRSVGGGMTEGRPGGSSMPKKRPEGNFPGRSNWEDLALTLIITQSQEELKITHRYEYEYEDKHIIQTFSLKGGQDVNVMRSGRGKFYSETTLGKEKIIIQGIHKVSTPTRDRSTSLKEEYSLSDNGEILILRANHLTPDREISARMVFYRKAEVVE